MLQLDHLRTWATAASACLIAAACVVTVARAEDPAPPANAAKTITDEQVVASMQKGIDYLLSQKKGDNWESDHNWGELTSRHHGGESALILYALLHAGDSLQDNPEYHSKLNWRGKELGPAVEWLCKNMPESTYATGLEASALALLPKRTDEKPGEGPRAALEACRWYVMTGMGKTGGYTYTTFNVPKGYNSFAELWTAWCKTKSKPVRADLSGYLEALYGSNLGPQAFLQEFGATLQTRLKASKDPAEIARLQAELREIPAFL